MKTCLPLRTLAGLAMIAALCLGAATPGAARRLSEPEKFPREHAAAVAAVRAAVAQAGLRPEEYFAEITQKEAVIHFWLRHQSHDPDSKWRGDSCGRCRTIDYDERTGKAAPLRGIR